MKTVQVKDLLGYVPEQNFRVSIFGSARLQPDTEAYRDAYKLAKQLGDHNVGIVTGGGPGIMEAGNKGHRDSQHSDSYSIGLTIELPWENESNEHVDLEKHFPKFSDRLDHFMALSQGVVIMPGGIGTCLELFYTWQLTQVGHMCKIPIIVFGDAWRDLVTWSRDHLLTDGLVSAPDFENVYCVDTVEEALEILLEAKQAYDDAHDKGLGDFCVNYKKYQL